MELLQLEYFYAVAQNQHMTRTAEQLHIAQPSLTQSIRRLEKELGVPLFYHSGRNIALTEYGVALQEALTPVLKTLHQIPNQLQQLAQNHLHVSHQGDGGLHVFANLRRVHVNMDGGHPALNLLGRKDCPVGGPCADHDQQVRLGQCLVGTGVALL